MIATTEQLLIGSILADEVIALDCCHKIGVHEDWFTNNSCRVAWLYIHQLKAKGSGIDTFILWKASKPNHGDLLAVNVTSKWVDAATGPAYAGHYAELLRGEWKRREALKVSVMLQEATKDGNPDTVIAECQHRLNELNATVDKPKTVDEIYEEIIERYLSARTKQGIGYMSPWHELNGKLNGWQSGDGPHILAARPGQGKSTLMMNDAKHHAKQGIKVSVSSLEMSEHKLRARMLCEDADISTFAMDQGVSNDYHINKLRGLTSEHIRLPVRIFAGTQTIEQFSAWATSEILKHGAQIIYLDYLQIISASKHHASRNEEVSAWMRHIRQLDKQFKTVPFVILSQLNRGGEMTRKERPTLRDLRDSGSIEQDAASVTFLHSTMLSDGSFEYEIGVDKNRFGPTGWSKINFNKSRQRFESIPELPKSQFDQ